MIFLAYTGYYSSYFILVLPFVLLSFWAQIKVKRNFKKYAKIPASCGLTGEQAARRVLDRQDLRMVGIQNVAGELTDHYSPREKIVRLSAATYSAKSIAAIGVALHEVGHAIQDKEDFLPNRIRSALLMPANIGSQFGPWLAVIGLFLNSRTGDMVFKMGIILFALSVLFYLVTLPVEIDASRRALQAIRETGLLLDDEVVGAKRVLRAAAMTYIASALIAVMSLLRLILLARRRD